MPTLIKTKPDGTPDGRSIPRLRRTATAFQMIEFVRPGSYWPNPYSIEQAFGVMQQAVALCGDVAEPTRWGRDGLADLLRGRGTVNRKEVEVRDIRDLERQFHQLVLARANDAIEAWRQRQGITPGGTFEAAFPHYKPFNGTPFQGDARTSEAGIRAGLSWLTTGCRGKTLAVSLNSAHLVARLVEGVTVKISTRGLSFHLEYKYEDTPHSSYWEETLAKSRQGEPFTGTLDRAVSAMRLLMGLDHKDPASLCEALNLADRRDGNERFWVLGRQPVKVSRFARDAASHVETCAKIGYGMSGARLVHLPSGQVLATDATYDWPRLEALRDIVLARFPADGPTPTAEDVEAIRERETAPVRPSFDGQGRYLFDRDGNPLSAEALATIKPTTPDSEIEPDHLF